MSAIAEESARKLLEKEGFTTIYVWTDAPGTFYDDHTHPVLTAHIILKGTMELTVNGTKRALKAGDRFDVPAGTVHAARVGKDWCTYVIGKK